jgi:hypothetical protein
MSTAGGITLMISNYFHDLSVALLVTNILAIYYIGRMLDERTSLRDEVLERLFRRLGKVTWWALGYVIIAGAVRAWFFMDFEWNPAVGKGQTAALVVKHVILVGLTVAGILVHLRYTRRYGA